MAQFAGRYCIDCHDAASATGGLDLETILSADFARQAGTWEAVVRRLRARQMPPKGKDRPDEPSYESAVAALEQKLDALPLNPGREPTFRRLTRTEYRNAIRDLLGLDIDPARWLPKDEESHGFDNITVGDLSPTLLNRYVSAASEISRLATGRGSGPDGTTIRIRPDITQEDHVEGLPFGTRGGALVEHIFPQTGEYEVEIRLARDRNEHVEGVGGGPHHLEILLDREPRASFEIRPPKDGDHSKVDQHLKTRILVEVGSRKLGVTFRKKAGQLVDTKRQPYEAHFNMHRHARLTPAVFQISITGPFDPDAESAGFPFDRSQSPEEILTPLLRRAYRRPVSDTDLAQPLRLFRETSAEEGFEAGIEMALSAILVSPQFLFRVERQPDGIAPDTAYPVSDFELATRLSFFIWSSIPDEQLLAAAERGDLRDPAVLERETRRLLADPRASALATNFANQWLHLRNLDSITPDPRQFVDFDDNLRQAMRRETELLFETVLRDDLGVTALLDPGFTFLNQRLAKHYGIPHIYGTRFRRIELTPDSGRGGLLRQGSILTVTSYANRTSPVLRGAWVLDNLLGTPAPPPPPDVPALEDNIVSAKLSVRERLAAHRANRQCAVCHDLLDPPGFALENFDAVGRWRESEDGQPVDASGGLPDGREFIGVDALQAGLLDRPEQFAGALTEKLLTYALGRGIEPTDASAVREILRQAEPGGYRLSALVIGIAKSAPFTMRMSE